MSLRRHSSANSFRFNSEIMAARKMILDLETFQTFFETYSDTLRRGGLKPLSGSQRKKSDLNILMSNLSTILITALSVHLFSPAALHCVLLYFVYSIFSCQLCQ